MTIPLERRLDAHRWLGEAIVEGDVTLWPIHTDHVAPNPLAVRTLEDAVAKGEATVLAVDDRIPDDAPTGPPEEVPPLYDPDDPEPPREAPSAEERTARIVERPLLLQVEIENRGSIPILILAGVPLGGPATNRMPLRDVVIPPDSGLAFDAARPPRKGPPIRSARDPAPHAQPRDIEAIRARLERGPSREPALVGLAWAMDGAVLGVRVFARADLLEAHLPALLAVIPVPTRGSGTETPRPPSTAAVVAFLAGAERAENAYTTVWVPR